MRRIGGLAFTLLLVLCASQPPVFGSDDLEALRRAKSAIIVAASDYQNIADDIVVLENQIRNINNASYENTIESAEYDISRFYLGYAKYSILEKERQLKNAINKELAREAVHDFLIVIDVGRDMPDWHVDVANAEYLAGSTEALYLDDEKEAFRFWYLCADLNQAGCLNNVANAKLRGEHGQALDVQGALTLHAKVVKTGIKSQCAGTFSAITIARVNYFLDVRRPGDDEIEWVVEANRLADQLAALQGRRLCDGGVILLDEFLMRLARNDRRPDLLAEFVGDSKSTSAGVIKDFFTGQKPEEEVWNYINNENENARKCSDYFYISWYLFINNDKKARKYADLLMESSDGHCQYEKEYIKKFIH